MAMPWRDIISTQNWNSVVNNYSSGKLRSRSQTLGRWFRSIGKKGTVLPKQVIRLNQLIPQYHSLDKSEFNNIDPRIGLLFQIADVCEQYCKKYNISSTGYLNRKLGIRHKTKVPTPQQSQRGVRTKLATEDSDDHSSLDLYIYSMMYRAVRKAQYLARIENLYLKVYPSHPVLSHVVRGTPRALIDWLRSPQFAHDEFCRLQASVRLEQLDPAHRAFEIGFSRDDRVIGMFVSPLNLAFCEWAGLDVDNQKISRSNPDKPFFLWLENHPICTAASSEEMHELVPYRPHDTSAVEYARADRHIGSNRIAMLMSDNGRLLDVRLGTILDPHAELKPFDTFTPEFAAGKVGEANAAAYVWTVGKEIFAGKHETGRLHHTTFVSGRKVRCAGMLGVRAGKIVFVSNNSGHYKPDDMHHLRPFIAFLKNENLFGHNAVVKGFRAGAKNVDGFLTVGTRARGSISFPSGTRASIEN